MAILVLGGAGFIGRHVVAALLARRERVVIGTRKPRRRMHVGCEVREAHLERLLSPAEWYPLLDGIDVVVNCVGILRERGRETYDKVHHRAPAALAALCARLGLRLLHVSALGLSDAARSGFIRSKLAGERAIAASGADYTIVRPSLLDGEGGFGARWLRRVARWPVHFVPAGATGRIAALDVNDLGRAIALLCVPHAKGVWREVELGGAQAWTIGDYLGTLRFRRGLREAARVEVPAWLARLGSHVCDLLHFSPYSFGHFEMMRHDNVPRENLLPVLLGRAPTPIGAPTVHEPSDAYGWLAVLRNVLPFFALLAAAPLLHRYSPAVPWLLAPAVGLFAYRVTIVMHDCIHRSLFASAALNNRVGTLLGGITGIDFPSFSRQHLLHHRLYGRPGDPQGFHYAGLESATRAGFAWHLLRPLLGWNLRYALAESVVRPRNVAAAVRSGDIFSLAGIQFGILAVVTGGGAHPWLAALPFASAATFGLFFSQLRGIAEHAGGGARSHVPHWLDRWLLYDLNFNYHSEHHLQPHRPSRDLPALHARLRDRAPAARSMFRTLADLAADRS